MEKMLVGPTPFYIVVKPGTGEDVCSGVRDGEGTSAICAFTLSTYCGLLPFITLFPLIFTR